MIKSHFNQESKHHTIYRPAYHRIPSTKGYKGSSLDETTCIVVPSMPYQPAMHIPIHHTLENATITYGTGIEYQKDLLKDVFFSPAMNDREFSPTPSVSSIQSDEEDDSLGTSELFSLEEEDLFNFGVEMAEKSANESKRRWSDSVIDKNKRQKLQEYLSEEPYPSFPDNPSTAPPRSSTKPTLFQKLTMANVDWCRYCGTTEGVNWRPGPWGKRTLCNKHGCDYKGYGFACKLPRLDLTGFLAESIDDRDIPVLQLYCSGCQSKESWEGNVLVRCEGCPKAYHQKCCENELSDDYVKSNEPWFCDQTCCENSKRKRIIVELPRKKLPLMCAPSKSNFIERHSIQK